MGGMKTLQFSRIYTWVCLGLFAMFETYLLFYGGRNDKYTHWYNVIHPVWLSVPQSILLAVPIILVGFPAGHRFGGWSSHMGRALYFISAGVLSWAVVGNGVFFIKQLSLSNGAVPYPWWSDVGYLGLLPLYGIGLFFLSRLVGVSGVEYLKLFGVAVLVILFTWWLALPTGSLGSLHGQEWVIASWNGFTDSPTFFFLNGSMASFIYLLSDIVILTWALIILLNSRKMAGGMFVPGVTLVTVSLFVQYLADLLFDQRIAKGSYFTGDIATILYAASMFTMVFALIRFAETERAMRAEMDALVAAAMAADHMMNAGDDTAAASGSADEDASTSDEADAPAAESDAESSTSDASSAEVED